MSNSKEYYRQKKQRFVTYWEKQREHRFSFASRKAIIDGLVYGILIFIIVNGLPEPDEIYQISIIFSVLLIFFGLIHYYVTFNIKEKSYQRTKKELEAK